MKKLFSFNLHITSKYKWGRGMSQEEFEEFQSHFHPKLIEQFPNLELHETKFSASSPEMTGDGEKYIYLHPMEFAGILEEHELKKLVSIVNEADPKIAKFSNLRKKELNAVTLDELKNELIKNRDDIKEELKRYGNPAMNTQLCVHFPHESRQLEEKYALAHYNYNFLRKLYKEIEAENEK